MGQKYSALLRLPFLHDQGGGEKPGLRLDPGLEDSPAKGRLRPDYPYAPREARKILAACVERSAGGVDALHGLDPRIRADARKLRGEMLDLASFAGRRAEADPEEEFKLAQQWLLRVWQSEHAALEIAGLEARCREAEACLADALWDPETELVRPRGPRDSGAASLEADPALAPPWKVCVINALHFVGPDVAVIMEGEMARDVAEILSFAPAQGEGGGLDGVFLSARAPLWQALGWAKAAPAGAPRARIFNCERLWLLEEKDD